MRSEDLTKRDEDRLRAEFYRVLDASRLLQLLPQSKAQLSAKHELLGEGTHCTAWRLRSQDMGKGALSLVLKRVHPGVADSGSPRRRGWLAALAKARGLGGLVPPFEVIEASDQLGLVMPYGEAPLSAAAPHWLPMERSLEALAGALAGRGLVLGDVPQGRCWQSIPFVFDLSDLNASR